MSCEEIRLLLSQYLDEQLDEANKNRVEEHLKSCADCTKYYNRLLGLQKIADDYEPGGDQEYWLKQKDKIIDKIKRVEAGGTTSLPVKKSRAITYRILAVAATITLVAIISIFELKYGDPEKLPFSKKSQAPTLKYSAPGKSQLKDINAIKKSEASQKGDNVIQNESLGAGRTDDRDEDKTMAVPEPAIPKAELASDMGVEAVQAEPEPLFEPEPADLAESEFIEIEDLAASAPRGKAEKAKPVAEISKEVVSLSEADEMVAPKKVEKKTTAYRITEGDEAGADESYERRVATQSVERRFEAKNIVASGKVDAFSDNGKMSAEQEPEKMFDEKMTVENEEYIKWRGKVDSLDAQYGYLLSVHREEIEVKGRQDIGKSFILSEASPAPSPPPPPYSAMANAYYTLALITPLDDEREAMLNKLKRLAEVADSAGIAEIEKFILKLESKSK